MRESFIRAEMVNIAQAYLPKVQTTVAEQNGIAGFISMLGAEVAALFVHPAHQGEGLGRKLLRTQTPPLTLEVFQANTRAKAFYARQGFRPTGTRRHEEAREMLDCMALDEWGGEPLYPPDG